MAVALGSLHKKAMALLMLCRHQLQLVCNRLEEVLRPFKGHMQHERLAVKPIIEPGKTIRGDYLLSLHAVVGCKLSQFLCCVSPGMQIHQPLANGTLVCGLA